MWNRVAVLACLLVGCMPFTPVPPRDPGVNVDAIAADAVAAARAGNCQFAVEAGDDVRGLDFDIYKRIAVEPQFRACMRATCAARRDGLLAALREQAAAENDVVRVREVPVCQ